MFQGMARNEGVKRADSLTRRLQFLPDPRGMIGGSQREGENSERYGHPGGGRSKPTSSLPAAKDSRYPSGQQFSSGKGRRTRVSPLRSISTRFALIRNSLGMRTACEPPEVKTFVFISGYA